MTCASSGRPYPGCAEDPAALSPGCAEPVPANAGLACPLAPAQPAYWWNLMLLPDTWMTTPWLETVTP